MKNVYLFNNGRIQRKDSTIYLVFEDGTKKTLPIENTENYMYLRKWTLTPLFLI